MNNLIREDGSPKTDGINNNTYNLLFKDYYNLPKEENNYELINEWYTIAEFTKLQEKKIFTKLLKLFSKNKPIDLNKITFNNSTTQYEYKINDLIITFDKLSNHLNNKELIKELTSNERNKKCHIMSLALSPNIEGSRVVTGYITIGNDKYLHSIIEYEQDGQTIVIDWNKNLMITKEQYIKLTKFVELASFEGKKFIEDKKILSEVLDIGVKPYVTFRDELMRDIQKNSHLFQTTTKDNENNNKKQK